MESVTHPVMSSCGKEVWQRVVGSETRADTQNDSETGSQAKLTGLIKTMQRYKKDRQARWSGDLLTEATKGLEQKLVVPRMFKNTRN